jgi:hypothetical protein
MPRKPKKQPAQTEAPKSFDEFADDGEGLDEDVATTDAESPSNAKSRDWRDVEKLKEERALRRLIDDDLDLD